MGGSVVAPAASPPRTQKGEGEMHSGLFRFQGHFSWQQFRAPGGEVLVSRVEKGGQHGNWLRRQGLFLRPSWRVSSKAEVYLLVEPC